MSNRYYNQFKGSLDRGLVLTQGTISIGADASVTTGTLGIRGAAVAKSGTGQYTITFDSQDVFPRALSCQLTPESLTTAVVMVKVKQWLNAAGSDAGVNSSNVRSLVIQTVTPSTQAPVDSTVAMKIHVSLLLKNSTSL